MIEGERILCTIIKYRVPYADGCCLCYFIGNGRMILLLLQYFYAHLIILHYVKMCWPGIFLIYWVDKIIVECTCDGEIQTRILYYLIGDIIITHTMLSNNTKQHILIISSIWILFSMHISGNHIRKKWQKNTQLAFEHMLTC